MKKYFKIPVLLVLLTLITSCNDIEITDELIVQESARFNQFLEDEFQKRLDKYPEFQTYLGIKKDADKWDDYSDKFAEKEFNNIEKTLDWLQDSVTVEALNSTTKLSYDLYKLRLEDMQRDYKFRLYNYPINQMHGLQAELPALLINTHLVSEVKDAENYIARLRAMKPLFEQLVLNLKARQEAGIMPPKFVFNRALNDCKNIIKGAPFDDSNEESALYGDISKKIEGLKIKSIEKDRLLDVAVDALLEGVLPAYTLLIKALEEQESVATTDDGVWKFPDGKDYYNYALKRTTTTDLSADDIHEIGLSEVARIHEEMRQIKDEVKFNGDLKGFFEFMKTDKQFYFEDSDKGRALYMEQAVQLIDDMKLHLDELFITKPKADLIVKAVEPFREKSAGKAFYQSPAPDGSRPGTYYANLYDLDMMPSYQMDALAYHEGIPGHHMQRAIQQELENFPTFRKYSGYTAYTEGWGLYSEYIPKEMGFYSDPYSDFGRLTMELWRACRLVVDTGIHAKKWTREEGIKYYTDNTPNSTSDAVKMVERHIVIPSQATAYKIGMLKILELRESAKQKLGDQFDIRKFHEVVLSNGAIPLNVLEDLINEWVDEELEVSIETKG